ncbi:Serine/threonine-protein kinase PknB [Botrimarina hoheduenensis]|uniref:Serine/threonine-protein kinase PknB n=2 Tax=Botrimarina hoheduenensis TaxID=2528000 RepID=A0A5C5WCR9_9BACT|nr:Serine/threonine-protein kinase PknB [Botrimarina hoheduenensis]
MTYASSRAGRTMVQSLSGVASLLKREVWVWPIVAVVLLASVGWFLRSAIERTMKESLTSELETLRDVEVASLRTWLDDQRGYAESVANQLTTRQLIGEIVGDPLAASPAAVPTEKFDPKPAGSGGEAAANTDPATLSAELTRLLAPELAQHAYDGYVLVDRQMRVRAACDLDTVGSASSANKSLAPIELEEHPEHAEFAARVLAGASTVSRPLPSVLPVRDHQGRRRTGTPVMYAAAPVRDENLRVIAALAFRVAPDREFTKILQRGQTGESGETYAFDAQGMMLSSSRFEEDLVLLGILPDEDGVRSILRVLVRDPGGDLTAGFRPLLRRREMPLTRMVASAAAGESASDVEGYPDYRGVQVVGAWHWLEDYCFGVATEIDAAEAYRPLTILKRTFWGLFALLALSSVAIFLFTLQVSRLRREAQRAAIEAQELGQYRLEQKLGAGAMGVVYKARHAMLRRPTAVKMLEPEKVTDEAVQAFEREVQITSQLCHPNTVAIFDYGRTPEGLFYYAMEYLDGIDLQQLVEQYGPQPVGRVVSLLTQVCGSLYEAHTLGLVHRDIKPANLMVGRRAAEPDVIKVLDFGLVKSSDDDNKQKGMAGTPLYMSPESIQSPDTVDARSDLYAVGAVGYFLLTGKPVFEAASLSELCRKHMQEAPVPPSKRLGSALPEELDDIILACLDKSRAKRPQTARDVVIRLQRVPSVDDWGVEAAELWWNQHERGDSPRRKLGGTTVSRDHAATIDHG